MKIATNTAGGSRSRAWSQRPVVNPTIDRTTTATIADASGKEAGLKAHAVATSPETRATIARVRPQPGSTTPIAYKGAMNGVGGIPKTARTTAAGAASRAPTVAGFHRSVVPTSNVKYLLPIFDLA